MNCLRPLRGCLHLVRRSRSSRSRLLNGRYLLSPPPVRPQRRAVVDNTPVTKSPRTGRCCDSASHCRSKTSCSARRLRLLSRCLLQQTDMRPPRRSCRRRRIWSFRTCRRVEQPQKQQFAAAAPVHTANLSPVSPQPIQERLVPASVATSNTTQLSQCLSAWDPDQRIARRRIQARYPPPRPAIHVPRAKPGRRDGRSAGSKHLLR